MDILSMTTLLAINTGFLLIMGITWEKSSVLNFAIKIILFALAISNGIVLLHDLGYIVKI